jgi:hypothetical protein
MEGKSLDETLARMACSECPAFKTVCSGNCFLRDNCKAFLDKLGEHNRKLRMNTRAPQPEADKPEKGEEEICQAHMAGQMDAGCKEPSWSNALAYYFKNRAPLATKEEVCPHWGCGTDGVHHVVNHKCLNPNREQWLKRRGKE